MVGSHTRHEHQTADIFVGKLRAAIAVHFNCREAVRLFRLKAIIMKKVGMLIPLVILLAMAVSGCTTPQASQLDMTIELHGYEPLHVPAENSCILLSGSADETYSRVNVVFIGSDFGGNWDDFEDLANRMLFTDANAMFTKEPYLSRLGDINIWLHPQLVAYTPANTLQIQMLADQCPNNYYIILVGNPDTYYHGYYGGRYSIVYRKPVLHYAAEDGRIITHELGGHAIGGLADTYYGSGNTINVRSPPVNCDTDPSCPKFAGFNVDCVTGNSAYGETSCGWYNGVNYKYRASYESVMGNTYSGSYQFNDVERYIIGVRIDRLIALNSQLNLASIMYTISGGQDGIPVIDNEI